MHVHDYEKLWLFASVLLIVAFISTVVYGAVGAGVAMVDDSGGTVNASDLSDTEFADPGVRQVGENEYEVYVQALRYAFIPRSIEVPADSEVTFHVTSRDVVHGFEVVGTNANVMVIPGQVSEITVRFDEPGEYGIVCNEYCGAEGHHDMAGELVVREPGNFSTDEGGESA